MSHSASEKWGGERAVMLTQIAEGPACCAEDFRCYPEGRGEPLKGF